jgi:hypothetical protein
MDREFTKVDFTLNELELLRATFASMYATLRNLDNNECFYTVRDLDSIRAKLGISEITDDYI